MKMYFFKLIAITVPLLLAATYGQSKGSSMHASGSFDVKVAPVEDKTLDAAIARFSLDKQFHGDLEGTSKGEMLSSGNPASGNAGYVALEKVTGTLQGRSGSFVLQHSASIKANVPQMTITVVPGSGTGQLEGISGDLTITFAPGGKHSYDFEYTLPVTH